jgi:heme O synthase-like polyprenyltransferase
VALVIGVALVALAVQFNRDRSERAARQLFLGSITYLPLIWTAMVLDH